MTDASHDGSERETHRVSLSVRRLRARHDGHVKERAMTGDIEDRELDSRLRAANERIRRLRGGSWSADNVIRFRVERHLEAVEETLADLNVRAAVVPAAGSYARRLLERDLCGAEAEIVFAQAKMEAAFAEEDHDLRRFAGATHRAMSAQRSALAAEIWRAPHEHTAR
jgi:hypothetical protein